MNRVDIKRNDYHACDAGWILSRIAAIAFVRICPVLFKVIILFSGLMSNQVHAEVFTTRSDRMTVENVAIVVNDEDARSVRAGEYYRVSRGVPQKNIIHVRIPNPSAKLRASEFAKLKWQIDAQLSEGQQIILLAWTVPYAVECNSITGAISLGFDKNQCENTCGVGKPNPYFNSGSINPLRDHGMRLTMLMPADSMPRIRELVRRGLSSNSPAFRSTAYYLKTSDKDRNSRAQFFPPSGLIIPESGLATINLNSDKLVGAHDIVIYQTGMAWVDDLDSLRFLPGALADHLTSFGGDLIGKRQMTALHWLDAGATASYGTVSEPCNYWQKFPNPMVLLKWYSSGATAVEAYWKSVAWPMQGLFVGEPLAAPYANNKRDIDAH